MVGRSGRRHARGVATYSADGVSRVRVARVGIAREPDIVAVLVTGLLLLLQRRPVHSAVWGADAERVLAVRQTNPTIPH